MGISVIEIPGYNWGMIWIQGQDNWSHESEPKSDFIEQLELESEPDSELWPGVKIRVGTETCQTHPSLVKEAGNQWGKCGEFLY